MGTQEFPFGGAGHAAVAVGVASPARTCPLCGSAVQPDALGLLECACGWGGPDDPLEAARGLSRLFTGVDRRAATRQARRELSRITRNGGRPSKPGMLYRGLLLVAATCIYALVLGVLVGAGWLIYTGIRDQAWLALAVGVVILALLALPIVERRSKKEGLTATPDRFPALFTMLRDVEAKVGGRLPRRVVLSPGSISSVGRRHPTRRLFLPETVLTLGVGAFPLKSEDEVRAIVAHELAHHRYGDTIFYHYTGWAEMLLAEIIGALRSGVAAQRRGSQRDARRFMLGGSGTQSMNFIGAILVTVVTLPLGIALVLFHLLRLRAARSAEFLADADAVRAYGAQAFMDGLTASIITGRTQAKLGRTLLASGPNYFASAEQHYQSLPASALATLRTEALRGYRSLEGTHPITSDRLRAALLVAAHAPSAGQAGPAADRTMPPSSQRSARGLLVGAGESSPERAELELTAQLREKATPRKRRAGK